MSDPFPVRLQLIVFAVVCASFTNIYIVQPVLPVLQAEFGADMVRVSFAVSAVILGIAVANLPFGYLADKLPLLPLILTGGSMVALGGLVCTATGNLWVLIGARFVQGLFIPALTTCMAAYLAKTLPPARLNVVMGTYVSATVLGGLGGRLLGGWIHPPLHWRYAMLSAAVFILTAIIGALAGLPRPAADARRAPPGVGFITLLRRWELVRIFACTAGAFAVFSSIFNYLPFRLAGAPFHFSTELTTVLYLVFVVGIFMGPVAGKLSNRFGSGSTLVAGSLVLGGGLALAGLPSIIAVVVGLLGICAGFFTVHAAAVGALNRHLSGGQGRANALYVLCYYLGGWLGITGTGVAYERGGWSALIAGCAFGVLVPLATGLIERRGRKRRRPEGST